MTKITPVLALALYRKINQGQLVTADSQVGPVHDSTRLGEALELLGQPCYVERDGKPGRKWQPARAVAFLREWADALEEAGEYTDLCVSAK